MSLIALLLLPFIGSCLAAVLPHNARNTESLLAGGVALVGAVQVAAWFGPISRGEVLVESYTWLPSLGLNLVLRVDGFAWLFALLVLGMGALVSLYARYYMSPQDPVPRFFSFFLAFMGSMLGVVMSGNLLQLVFFWELTSLFSFLLIGYWHHRRDARRGAYMALVVTGMGGLCLLAGVLLLGHIAGSYELEQVLASGERIRQHGLYPAMLVLVLLGALTKSAQFPFHFWLPRAMAAPTPVSAYLHSATMVKAGVFLLARLWPALSGSEAWFWIVAGAGACTLLLGAWCAIFQHDLKGLLAYSTISHLGLITLLLGLNSDLAAVAAVFHLINHATFKASLFMAAGIIDHESGTRDIRRLSGLARMLPFTATLAMVASAAMAGVPLMNGFLSKEMFFAETVFIDATPWVEVALPVIATLAGTFSVAYSLRFTVDVFFGPPATDLPHTPHEPPRWMRLPVELLVLACLVVGIFPAWAIGPILATSAAPVVGGVLPAYSLAIWHGFNAPLIMSLIAMLAGIALYMSMRRPMREGRLQRPPLAGLLDGQRIFEWLLLHTRRTAAAAYRRLAPRPLQAQLFLLVAAALLAAAWPLLPHGLSWGSRPKIAGSGMFVVLWVIAIACAVGAAWQAKYHRLAALTMVGVCGLMTCITFIWFSAPDLALTQLVVEVVTTILILLGLRWLPRRLELAEAPGQRLRARARRLRDALLAIGVGGGMAALAYAMLTRPTPNDISGFYLRRALPEGGGTNVVNVMLVDFRGFDTLGEITVLAVVSLTVFALLRRFRPARESMQLPPQQQRQEPDLEMDLINARSAPDTAQGVMTVPAVLVRLVLPIALVVAASLFLRGHNEPGGGFVAGLVVSVAFILQYMVAGTQWVEARMPLRPLRWLGAGLLCATATGLAAVALGYPFLTTHTAHWVLPLFGEVHLASALFFDVGVFTVVVGSTLLILTALAHQAVRAHRPGHLPRATAPKGAA
ncbi:monovalent cation/H+ antiporter subunit A [Pseudomonas typographi]|uniref:monovalent cation/H+ antiporter subunit A n=1 Tax=Pseudomonas typographi TaxID=2715964 RepID=UPI0016860729|nr:monovalent cation/H+ antiporter subunit A [Pseudomonas typographi]MBD1554034.1 monovalent cation/H+ antiporter subunit A [Pseudomonas typographi]